MISPKKFDKILLICAVFNLKVCYKWLLETSQQVDGYKVVSVVAERGDTTGLADVNDNIMTKMVMTFLVAISRSL